MRTNIKTLSLILLHRSSNGPILNSTTDGTHGPTSEGLQYYVHSTVKLYGPTNQVKEMTHPKLYRGSTDLVPKEFRLALKVTHLGLLNIILPIGSDWHQLGHIWDI